MNYGSYVPKFGLRKMKICVEHRIEEALLLSLGFQQLMEKQSDLMVQYLIMQMHRNSYGEGACL